MLNTYYGNKHGLEPKIYRLMQPIRWSGPWNYVSGFVYQAAALLVVNPTAFINAKCLTYLIKYTPLTEKLQ
jgi:hypothetical protein